MQKSAILFILAAIVLVGFMVATVELTQNENAEATHKASHNPCAKGSQTGQDNKDGGKNNCNP